MEGETVHETEFEKCFTGYKCRIISCVFSADKGFKNGAFQYEVKYWKSDFQYINKHK